MSALYSKNWFIDRSC